MAIGAITGGVYGSEVTGTPQKVNTEYSGNENLNITEAPVGVSTPGSNQGAIQTGTGQDGEFKERPASERQIKDAISKANSRMHMTRCEYAYHEDTKRISIKVIDEETDKVIREIPPEETMAMLQKMWEMAGLFVDEKR